MFTATPSAYARLPTFSAVIDGLAAGLGIALNKEDALAGLGSFSRRIDTFSGSSHRSGLEDQLLDLLTGSNKALRSLVQTRLGDAETMLTDARAIPLVTEATEAEGLRHFIEIWAAPWIAHLLADARKHPDSVLDCARLLLEVHVASITDLPRSYLATWKAEVKRALPPGISAPEFRATLDRVDQRSRRKLSSITRDIANLRDEMQSSSSSPHKLDDAVGTVCRLYLAGIATMRLCAMAAEIIPEDDLIAMVTGNLIAVSDRNSESQEEAQERCTSLYWDCLDPAFIRSNEYQRLSALTSYRDEVNFDKLRADSRAIDPAGLWMPAIDYSEGVSHLFHGRNDLAERCLQSVVASASSRQLGEIAAGAASILIALRLTELGPLKFEELNPLVRVRIDNMHQWNELTLNCTPTPFSDWSPRPTPSFYDSHLMMCVAFFNSLPRTPKVSTICNPLLRFDASLESMIMLSRKAGARMKEVERKRPAIFGTSIKPYQVLRDHLYYRDALFELNPLPDLPGMDAYAMLPLGDQLRLLRFVDPEQFQLDLRAHGLEHDESKLD